MRTGTMHRRTAAAALLGAVVCLSCADAADPGPSGDANRGPAAEIERPADGSAFIRGETIVFEGSADDPEDGALEGPFLDWTSSIDARIGLGPSVTASDLSVGEHRVTLGATDSDGATDEDEISLVVSENRTPSVVIASPADGSEYGEGQTIQFEGSANDPEDGPLGGGSLLWESQTDGEIGTGQTLEVSDLSAAQHRIFLTATDSHGASDFDDVIVRVEAATP